MTSTTARIRTAALVVAMATSALFSAQAQAGILHYVAVGVAVHAVNRHLDKKSEQKSLQKQEPAANAPVKKQWMTQAQKDAFFNKQTN